MQAKCKQNASGHQGGHQAAPGGLRRKTWVKAYIYVLRSKNPLVQALFGELKKYKINEYLGPGARGGREK